MARRIVIDLGGPKPAQARRLAALIEQCALGGNPTGLLAPVGPAKTPLLAVLAAARHPQHAKADARALADIAAAGAHPALTRVPAWDTAPLGRALWKLAEIPGARPTLPYVLDFVCDLAHSQQAGRRTRKRIKIVLGGALSPLYSVAVRLKPGDAALLEPLDAQGQLDFFVARLEAAPPGGPRLLRQHTSRLERLFARQSGWSGARAGGPHAAPGARWRAPKAPDGDAPDYDQLPDTHPARQSFRRGAAGLNRELAGRPARSDRPGRGFSEPFPRTVQVNPTPDSPAALTAAECAAALAGAWRLPSEQAQPAALALLLGDLYGQTRLLAEADPHERPAPSLRLIEGGLRLQPRPGIGRPGWYDEPDPDPAHRSAHVASAAGYPLPLLPPLAGLLADVRAQHPDGPLYPGDDYAQAMADLNAGLQAAIPTAAKLTPGRLGLSFQARANGDGLDWAARAAVCGRGLAHHEMGINYTLVELDAAFAAHARQAAARLDAIEQAYRARAAFGDWPDWQLAPLPPDWTPGVSGLYTGSWSTPPLARVAALLARLETELAAARAPLEIHNARVRLAGVLAPPLTGMRPLELDSLALAPRQPLAGANFIQRVKGRAGEAESVMERWLPGFYQPLWWAALESSRAHGARGLALLDPYGKARPFRLADELARLERLLDLPGQMRPHGLRHLSRTLYRQAGLSDAELALLLNHWGAGFELANPARLGADLSGFPARLDAAALQVAAALGLTPGGWL